MIELLWQQILSTSWIEWTGVISGILAVWLSIREKVAAWPLFILCYIAYAVFSYQLQLPATTVMNGIFIVLSGYGWFAWTRSRNLSGASSVSIHKAPTNVLIIAGAIWGIGTLATASLFNSSNAPYAEAFATCGAYIAQWMLSRKYIENWLCWIVSDAIFIWIWWDQSAILSAGLFVIFILLAFKGWRDWTSLSKTK